MLAQISGSKAPVVASRLPAQSQTPAVNGSDDDVYVPMTTAEKIGKSIFVGGLAALPVVGAVITEVVGGQLDMSGTGADIEVLAHATALGNIGSSIALGVGAVIGGSALTAGAVGLGLCGLLTAAGYEYWAERTHS